MKFSRLFRLASTCSDPLTYPVFTPFLFSSVVYTLFNNSDGQTCISEVLLNGLWCRDRGEKSAALLYGT